MSLLANRTDARGVALSDAILDMRGNLFVENASRIDFMFDTLAPTLNVTLNDAYPFNVVNGNYMLKFEFSEPINNFELSDINMTNANGSINI